jgi:GNAT superfamily N-acetyltransferase
MIEGLTISRASRADLGKIVELVNSAYRGEYSKQGWTTEAHFIAGELRTDIEDLEKLYDRAGTTFLKCTRDENVVGSVFLDHRENDLYLGMLTVDPAQQTGGIGKQLMYAAEEHGRKLGCSRIVMNVVSLRKELIEWYERRGYTSTGETKPFPNDPRFGVPTRQIEFIIMEKKI